MTLVRLSAAFVSTVILAVVTMLAGPAHAETGRYAVRRIDHGWRPRWYRGGLGRGSLLTVRAALVRVIVSLDRYASAMMAVTERARTKSSVVGYVVLALTFVSCVPKIGEFEQRGSLATLEIASSCAPAGWTAGFYPHGASDVGFFSSRDVVGMRLFVPESVVAGKAASKGNPRAVYVTEWWRDVPHVEEAVAFDDGRTGTRYRSQSSRQEVTTEFTGRSGTWQLYGAPGPEYEAVLRCIEPRLAGASR